MSAILRAPFPWFGGKSRAASIIWQRFGDVANYVEPFAGSLAVLLARPTPPRIETVNDLDCMVANFWRATQEDPESVAKFADWPVNEADLHARHRWLVEQLPAHRERMTKEPDYHDPKIAGLWVWGLCQWIGTGWCVDHGVGESAAPLGKLPIQLPHLSGTGRGIHRKLPHLSGTGRGIHRKLPHLSGTGRGAVADLFEELAARLRGVRVACGNWSRVLGESVTWRNGITGILLDPPYADGNMEYAAGAGGVSGEVAAWARDNGENPLLRIALCGYEGEHQMPDTWECVPWKAKGGYGNQRKDGANDNARRERIWFSPHCLKPDKGQIAMFGAP